jgi:L-gulonate 3-dehydrogenase
MQNQPQHVAAIVGVGLIGRSWSVTFARGGFDVRLFDPVKGAAARSYDLMPQMLRDLQQENLLHGQSADAVMARVRVVYSIADAVVGAQFVQECGPENREVKAGIFSEIDQSVSSDAVMASSTSIILPSLFTGHIAHRAQCVVAHPLNPPHLIPAVELVPAPWTSAETMAKAKDILTAIGQRPIVMLKEIDGFLMNRLQGALLEECFRLLEGGYASVEDIDASLKDGLAMRWSFMGPFETIDLNAPGGIRDYVERYNGGFVKMRETAQWRADWLGETLDKAELARRATLPVEKVLERQNWRDRQLMRLAASRKSSASPQAT